MFIVFSPSLALRVSIVIMHVVLPKLTTDY